MALTLPIRSRNAVARHAWGAARTLADLADLMACWLAGHLATRPGYGSRRPDPETTPLLPVLVRACRAGWMTDCSQPGTPGPAWDGTPHRDRAYVTGYAGPGVAYTLDALAHRTGLLAIVQPPPAALTGLRPPGLPVSLHEGAEVQWAGGYTPPMQHRHTWAGLHPAALAALDSAYQVTLVDPEWGRTGRLWDVLADALAGAR